MEKEKDTFRVDAVDDDGTMIGIRQRGTRREIVAMRVAGDSS